MSSDLSDDFQSSPLEESDDFRMFSYKIKRCTKTRAHDWTQCPYAHRGEKAKRRDPRRVPYNGISCVEFRRDGECSKGQFCPFSHGVFEFWLHPSRYRTRRCKAGVQCERRVCFFAHSDDQLRASSSAMEIADLSEGFGKVGISEVEEREERDEFPHIDWIFDLVK